MRREILGLLLILPQAMAMAQTFSGTVKDNRSRKGLDYVSVVVFDGKKKPICFQHTDEKGRFQIEVNPDTPLLLFLSHAWDTPDKYFQLPLSKMDRRSICERQKPNSRRWW